MLAATGDVVPCSPFPAVSSVRAAVASNARRCGRGVRADVSILRDSSSSAPTGGVVPRSPFPVVSSVRVAVASNARRYGRRCSPFPVPRCLVGAGCGGEQCLPLRAGREGRCGHRPLRAGLFPVPRSLFPVKTAYPGRRRPRRRRSWRSGAGRRAAGRRP